MHFKTLAGKTAIVTGAGSGIGAATAARFVAEGMNVVAADIRAENLHAVESALKAKGGRITSLATDVSDPAAVEALARHAENAFGEIDIAFNNAGVAMHGTPLIDIPVEDWRWVIDVNIMGMVNCIRSFVPLLKRHGRHAHVINTASIGGLQVNPAWLTGAYSMTKYAAVALSEALEQELASTPVKVSVLCPSAVATNLADAGSRPERFGGGHDRPQQGFLKDAIATGAQPDDVAGRVVDALRGNEFYIFTDASARAWIETRHKRISTAFDALGKGN